MSGENKHDIRLLKWKDINSFFIYTSIISQNFKKATKKNIKKGNPQDARFVYDFKKYFKNSEIIKIMIDSFAAYHQCKVIVPIPASTTEPNSLQKLYASVIYRHIPTEPRKYNHLKPIDEDYKNSYSISHDLEPCKILLVDDICTTGKTINYFAEEFEKRGFEVVKLALAIDYKLEPNEDILLEIELPNDEAQQEEKKEDIKNIPEKKFNYELKAGAKLKLIGKKKERFLEAISNGLYIKQACVYAGISYDSYFKYQQRAKKILDKLSKDPDIELTKDEQEHIDLINSIEQCETTIELEAVSAWKDAFKKDWRSAEAFLSKRFKKRWSDKPEEEEDEDDEGDTLVNLLEKAREEFKDIDADELFDDPQYKL